MPAPFKVSADDPWLEVRFGVDGGVATGWVYAALLCRPSLAASAGRFTLLGWTSDPLEARVGRDGAGLGCLRVGQPGDVPHRRLVRRPALQPARRRPAAALTLSRRRDLDAALNEHVIVPQWTPTLRDTQGWTVSLERGACADSRFAACPVVVREPAGLRGDVLVSLPRGAADAEGGFPRVELVGVLRRGHVEDAILRVAMSDASHRFEVVRLSETPRADWRDFLPGVQLSGRPGPASGCGASVLEGHAVDAAAEAHLRALNARFRPAHEDAVPRGGGRRVPPVRAGREGPTAARAAPLCVHRQRVPGGSVPSGALGVPVGRDFAVGSSRSTANPDYSCDP